MCSGNPTIRFDKLSPRFFERNSPCPDQLESTAILMDSASNERNVQPWESGRENDRSCWYHICKASGMETKKLQSSHCGTSRPSYREHKEATSSAPQWVPTCPNRNHMTHTHTFLVCAKHSKSSGVITTYHPVEELSCQTRKWRRVLHRINVVYSPYQVSKYAPWLASMHWVNTPRMKGIAWFWLSPFPSPKIG